MKNQPKLERRSSGSLLLQRNKAQLHIAALAGMSLFGFSAASAEEAEDSSAAFETDKAELAATLGVADPGSTVSTDENGMTSAVAGLSALKLLVVSQDEDGNLTYAHVSSDADSDEIAEATDSKKAAEE